MYIRNEENDAVGVDVNNSLNALHSALIAHCPTLLPLLSNLVVNIKSERKNYNVLSHKFTHLLTHSLTHSLTLSLTHSGAKLPLIESDLRRSRNE